MNQKDINMIETLCNGVRNYPNDADMYLNLIVSICKLNKID